MRTLVAPCVREAGFFRRSPIEQAKVVGLAAATVGVTAFWALLLMAPSSPDGPMPSAPVVQPTSPQLDAQPK